MTLALLLALLLDAAAGEPRWLWDRLPHPAVLMGRAVGGADAAFNRGPGRRARGAAVMAALVAGAALLGLALQALPGMVAEVLVGAILLAQRSLAEHVAAVADALDRSDAEGRRVVAMIVGRDTDALEQPGIARAAIESAAENLSDGVIAPALWFLIAGLPGLLVYKITNTADSMIGHRTPRHEAFGWAAARLDDVLNWLPARLTAALIAVAGGLGPAAWPAIRADAALHRSPNAGWPEAAMARVLDVALAGPRSYAGRMQDFPFVHPQGAREIGPAEVRAGVAMLWRTWGLFAATVAVAAVIAGL